jgi:thiol:disulfide interchange protein DsbD
VKPTTYVSVDKVARGQMFEAAVVVQIATGFHMNSHKPSEDYLIPTTVTPNPPAGIKVVDTVYPAGKPKTFGFSPNKPLDVYSDTVTVTVKMAADDTAALGAVEIPAILRYQACNDTMCLPPVRMPVTIAAEIAPSGTAAKKVHPEIFAAKN